MRRGWGTWFVLALACSIVLSPVASARAESVTALQSRLAELKSETRSAGKAFDRAYWRLDATDRALARTEKRIADTQKRLAAARLRLNQRAAAMYRRDGLEDLGFLLGAFSFEELVTRLDYIGRIGDADARAVQDVEELAARLRRQRTDLKKRRSDGKRAVAALRKQRDVLQAKLKSKQSEFEAVRVSLAVARSGGAALPSGVSAYPGPNGMVFPVAGSYYYADTWGASRSGGRRRHQGTDIMAPRGTRVVAVLSGTVRTKTNSLGGRTIWLTGSNGWSFYYAHLDSWTVKSGHVRAGQVIGTVGSTGNARGGSPHLHFEIHPHGSPVNPYPYLREME